MPPRAFVIESNHLPATVPTDNHLRGIFTHQRFAPLAHTDEPWLAHRAPGEDIQSDTYKRVHQRLPGRLCDFGRTMLEA